jgi:hypothetical protein
MNGKLTEFIITRLLKHGFKIWIKMKAIYDLFSQKLIVKSTLLNGGLIGEFSLWRAQSYGRQETVMSGL